MKQTKQTNKFIGIENLANVICYHHQQSNGDIFLFDFLNAFLLLHHQLTKARSDHRRAEVHYVVYRKESERRGHQ